MGSRVLCLMLGSYLVPSVWGQSLSPPPAPVVEGAISGEGKQRRPPRMDVLSDAEWDRIDASVERARAWLATQQESDGSFLTKASGQPAVTSLCVIAFLSGGHTPGQGRYGETLNRAIDFVLNCQRDDGLFSLEAPIQPADDWNAATQTATYNHAIAGLDLGASVRRFQPVAAA